jgi:hypothetical protein
MNKANFVAGDRVRISPDHPEPTLQNRAGRIVALPNKDRSEYLVQINVGPLAGRKVLVHGYYLKLV